MSRINDKNKYPLNTTIALTDFLIGTKGSNSETLNFDIQRLLDFIQVNTPLQIVTDNGNETTNDIIVKNDTGIIGVRDTLAESSLAALKLDIITKKPYLLLSNIEQGAEVRIDLLTENHVYQHPNKAGTYAMTSDIVIPTKEVFISILNQTDFVLNTTPNNVDVWIEADYQVSYTLVGNTVTLPPQQVGKTITIRKF